MNTHFICTKKFTTWASASASRKVREAAQTVALSVVVEDQEVERLRQAHATDEDGGADPRHHETGDGGDVRQHVEQDELPDVRVVLDPLADRTDLLSRLRCVLSVIVQLLCSTLICGLVAEEAGDDAAQSAEGVSVGDFDDGVDHRGIDHALGHLAHGLAEACSGMNRGVEVRSAGLLTNLGLLLGERLGDGTRHEAPWNPPTT